MKVRRLLTAFLVLTSLAPVLFFSGLWWRSYRYLDYPSLEFPVPALAFYSRQGTIRFSWLQDTFRGESSWEVSKVPQMPEGQPSCFPMTFETDSRFTSPVLVGIRLPHWFLVLVTGAAGIGVCWYTSRKWFRAKKDRATLR